MNVQEALQKRRSVRKFTDMPVSEADVALLLHAAMSGPSACNRCPWEFYVISNESVLSAMRKASRYTNIPSPMAIVVCASLKKALPGHYAAYWVQDCAAATENILLEAVELGLGAVWCGIHPQKKAAEAVADILTLGEDQVPLNIIFLGHPAETPPARDQFDEQCVHFVK